MRTNKLINKFFVAGAMLLCAGMTSCEDFLTVLPTDRITEDDFWKTKADLDAVRSAAYVQMSQTGVTSRILYWGELRSDNLTQNDMKQTNVELMRKAVLQPTNNMFDWAPFYTGINYCNKVLENGEVMTKPGAEVDPSFRRGDWLPIKAEMIAMRALYYFNLVKAYRNVPFVTHSVSTDAEAVRSKSHAMPGEQILDILIAELDSAKNFAALDYSSINNRKGRFSKRSIRALLADIQLWRACMIKNIAAKGDKPYRVNAETNDTVFLTQADLNTQSNELLKSVITNCDAILADIQKDYEKDLIEDPSMAGDKERNKDFPYLGFIRKFTTRGVPDLVYSNVFGLKNSRYESIFELQYDGVNSKNNAINDNFGKYESGMFKPSLMVGSAEMTSSAESNINPERGFGKCDIRLVQTFAYNTATAQRSPMHKNTAKEITIPDLTHVGNQEFLTQPTYRGGDSQDANWPFYRLTDIMLMKAEAIARTLPSDCQIPEKNKMNNLTAEQKQLIEGFNLVNSIFKRCNPGLTTSDPVVSGIDRELQCDRMNDKMKSNNTQRTTDLLKLVINERQREFVGEGKRWYDLVRQCEATGDVAETLNSYTAMSKDVKNRLRGIYAMYVPIYSEELKVNGVEFGGGLVQNPVWDRYTVK